MILLDHTLLAQARKVATGANIHRIREIIFVYEQAVELHNAGRPAHRIYEERYEVELCGFVAKNNQDRAR